MNSHQSLVAARGLTDEADRLITADEPLVDLQEACGGRLSGPLAVPELLELVRQSRELGLRIAREFSAFDGQDIITGFARVHPLGLSDTPEGQVVSGCEILIENWLSLPQGEDDSRADFDWLNASDKACAEITARLDKRQRLQILTSISPDAQELATIIDKAPGKLWSDYVELDGMSYEQPLHWRLFDGALARIPGSNRIWRVRLIPSGGGPTNIYAPQGFELLFIADRPLQEENGETQKDGPQATQPSRLVGSALTPVLRQPIARIIANAETIHARLAGPLRDEYSEYAANIATAGQHLSGMLDDLADLEVVEDPDFQTAKERVDLVDVSERAAGILGVRAKAKDIIVVIAGGSEPICAHAEFRRVLQILINLIGNAIAYSPEGSKVTVNVTNEGENQVCVRVNDQGPGVNSEQAAKIFDKFERLGRESDGGKDTGSGLGLFISRKLALAMSGDLLVERPEAAEGEPAGAQFSLLLPALTQN